MRSFGAETVPGTEVVAFGTGGSVTHPQAAQSRGDANGKMHVPEDYLRTYRYLGTWAVLADEGHGANELDVVYPSPGTVNTFQKSEIGRASCRERVCQYV